MLALLPTSAVIKDEGTLLEEGTPWKRAPQQGMVEMIRVLLVDDDQATRAELAKSLSDLGLAVLEATAVDDALAKARTESPDVILLDVHMPGMDGFEVLRKLRECPVTRSTPVVMFTGLPVVERAASSMALGATHYLTRPWNIDILETTVRVAIREGMAASEQDNDEPKDKMISFVAEPNVGMHVIPHSKTRG